MADEHPTFETYAIETLADKMPTPNPEVQNRIILAVLETNPEILNSKESVTVPEDVREKFLSGISNGLIKPEDVAKAIAMTIKTSHEENPEIVWKQINTEDSATTNRMKALIAQGVGRSTNDRESITQTDLNQFMERHATPQKAAKEVLDLIGRTSRQGIYAEACLKFLELTYGEQWKTYQQFKLMQIEAIEKPKKSVAVFEKQGIPTLMLQETERILSEIDRVKSGPDDVYTETTIGREFIRETGTYDEANKPTLRWEATSGRHFKFGKNRNGSYEIIDISTNGTEVNGVRLTKMAPKPIQRGDKISWKTGNTGGKITITI